jgi:hypothetical protein
LITSRKPVTCREFRAGSLQGLLPGAHTDPDVHVIASGSSRCGTAVPLTTGSFRGDTLVRYGVLGVVLTPRPQRGTPFAPPGPEGRSPASKLLWGAATSCRPSRRASFPSLGDTTVSSLVRPRRPRTWAADQPGVGKPGLRPALRWRRQGLPSSRETRTIIRHVPPTPV